MKIAILLPLLLASLAVSEKLEMSVCGTEVLLPIDYSEAELEMLRHTRPPVAEPTAPPPAGVRNPAEFEPATGIMVRWPLGVPYDFLVDVSNNGELWVIVSAAQQGTAQSSLTSAGVNMASTDFIIGPTNSIWVRDYGPWFIVLPDGTQGIFNYEYNRASSRPQDNQVPGLIGSAWGIPVYSSAVVHTGGNYMSGGMGEAMSTDAVYEDNDEPDTWVDQQMHDYLGITSYTTYPDPQASYIDHIDCWAKMLSPDRIMVLQVPPSHGDYAALEAVAQLISESPSQYGHPWNVYRVFSSGTEGYVNGLLHNDTYYMPVWNTGNDSPAAAAFSVALPGYTVKTVYHSGFVSTDALHCRTRNVMDREALELLHIPVDPVQPADPVNVTAFIRPNQAHTLVSATVHHRAGSGGFSQVSMTPAGSGNYTANIPGYAGGSQVEYYIRAEDSSGRVVTHPRHAPQTWFNTYTVSSTGTSGEEGGTLPVTPVLRSGNPFSGALVFTGQPGTAFTVYDQAGRVVHSSSASSDGTMEWYPASSSPDGVYYARFTAGGSASSRRVVLLRN